MWGCSLSPKIIKASIEKGVDALVHDGAFILKNLPAWWDEEDELGDGEGAYPFAGILMITGDITKNDAQKILELSTRWFWAVIQNANPRGEEFVDGEGEIEGRRL